MASDIVARLPGHVGPAHIEVKLSETGPKLIEVNPRQPGGLLPVMIERVTGRNVFVEAATRVAETDRGRHADAARALCWWQLYGPSTWSSFVHVEEVEVARRSPGVELIHVYAEPGRLLASPSTNSDCLGSVLAEGSDEVEALARARDAAAVIRIRAEHLPTGPLSEEDGPQPVNVRAVSE